MSNSARNIRRPMDVSPLEAFTLFDLVENALEKIVVVDREDHVTHARLIAVRARLAEAFPELATRHG